MPLGDKMKILKKLGESTSDADGGSLPDIREAALHTVREKRGHGASVEAVPPSAPRCSASLT